MPTSVLYKCHCHPLPDGTSISTTSTTRPLSPTSHPASSSVQPLAPSPSLPSYSASATNAYHPLPSLYFCEECDAIRCSSCVTLDIAAWFCPNCLFEVPGASVRSEKARCARNCFSCPICQQVLQVSQTDPGGSTSALDPLSAAASIGEPPWFLSCTVCRWDSKQVGITFEKPTGLSLQLQKQEDSQPALIELDRLKDHFEPFLRSQLPDEALVSSSSRLAGSGGGGSAATRAASAALRQSKLLRDVPMLASHPAYLGAGGSRSSRSKAGGATASSGSSGVGSQYAMHLLGKKEELREYKALSSWESGRGAEDSRGVLGRREESRRKWAEGLKDADSRVSGLEQRWGDTGDQPARVSELLPARLPLKAKSTKRCPACRHIIIKPDTKAAQTRYKIKLVAHNYLPDIWLGLVGTKVGADVLQEEGGVGGAAARAESRLARRQSTMMLSGGSGGTTGRSIRARPTSMLLSGTSSSAAAPSLVGGFMTDGGASTSALDEERLLAGRTYVYEATFTNPLDDAMNVRIGIGLPKAASRERERDEVQEEPEEVHTESATSKEDQSAGAVASDETPSSSPAKTARSPPTSASRPRLSRTVSRSAREQLWTVHASTTSFPISAFNEVWELEEEEAELLGDRSKRGSTGPTGSGGGKGEEEEDDDVEDEVLLEEEDEEEERALREEEENLLKSGTTDEGSKEQLLRIKARQAALRRNRRRRSVANKRSGLAGSRLGGASGIVRRKGHTTTVAFELALGREAIGDIEFALVVTYTYKPEGEDVVSGSGGKTGASSSSQTQQQGYHESPQQQQQQQQQQDKSFTFSTAVRLGKCIGLPMPAAVPTPSTTLASATATGMSGVKPIPTRGGSADESAAAALMARRRQSRINLAAAAAPPALDPAAPAAPDTPATATAAPAGGAGAGASNGRAETS